MSLSDDLKWLLHLDKDKPADEPTAVPAATGDAAAGVPGLPAQSGNPTSAPQTPTPAAQGRVLLIHG
jgi:hypothetical protein